MIIRRQIPLDQVVIPEVRITAVYDDELTALLHDSIEATGQVVPIIVVEFDSLYYVADGKHRVDEARARGEKKIDAIIRDGKPEDVLLLNLVTNRLRGKTKASEMVTVIQSLWKDYNLDSEQIRDRTGISREHIERLQQISEASLDVREALDEEKIGVGIAFEISRLPHPEQQAQVLNFALLGKPTVAGVKDLVDQTLRFMAEGPGEPSIAPRREPPPPPACSICGTQPGPENLRPAVLCPICHGIAFEAVQVARQQAEAADSTMPDKKTEAE
jgi:ParB/RepB/Spo0J family partition protein